MLPPNTPGAAATTGPEEPMVITDVEVADQGYTSNPTVGPSQDMDEKIAPMEVALPPKEEEKKKAEKPKMVPYFSLMRLATTKEKIMWFLGMAGGLGQGLTQVLMMVRFGNAFDATQEVDDDKVTEIVLQFIMLGGIAFLFGTLQSGCTNYFAEAQRAKMRSAYFKAVLRQDIGWFDQNTPGSLPGRIDANVETIGTGIGDKVGILCFNLGMFVFGYGIGLYRGWQIALVMTACIPLMSVGAAIMGKAMQDIQGETQSWYNKAGGIAEEVLFALRTVVSFGAEITEHKRYSDMLTEARWGGVKSQIKLGIGMGYTMAIMFCSYALAFWFGATLRKDGHKSPMTGEVYTGGDVIGVFFCVLMGGFALGGMGEPIQAISAARAAGASFYEILDHAPSVEEKVEGGNTGEPLQSIEKIEFQNVTFSYPARPDVVVLNNANFSISAGQKVAFVGESGSGKSTIIALIERFYDPDSGKVLVNGKDIKAYRIGDLRKVLGFVGQEPVLFTTTIRNNILYGMPTADKEELSRICKSAQLDFVDKLPQKLDTFVGAGGSQFSGGQKQRIALARALIKKPTFLLLDEATSALDQKSEKMVQATLDALDAGGENKITTISVAHRLSTVRKCDKIFVLKRGDVVETGTHESLMEKKGEYYGLVASQESAHAAEASTGAAGDHAGSAKTGSKEGSKDKTGSKTHEFGHDQQEADMEAEKKRAAEIAKTYKAPMGRLFSFCKPEMPVYFPLAVLGSLIFGAKEPLLGLVLIEALASFYIEDLDEMVDEVSNGSLMFLGVACAAFIGGFLQFSCFGVLKEAMTTRMRSETLKHMMRMEVGFHDNPEHTPSKLTYALQTYAFRASNLMTGLGAYAGVFASVFVGIAFGFFKSWRMAGMMLACVPVMGFAQYLAMLGMLVGSGSNSDDLKLAQQVISDAVNNVRTVRSSGAEPSLVALVEKFVGPVMQRGQKKAVTGGLSFGLSQATIFIIFAFGFWWAFRLIKDGHNTFEDAMSAMNCVLFGAMGIGGAMGFVGDVGKAKVACHDMFQLLDRKSEIDGIEPKGTTPSASLVGTIEFEAVAFNYPFRPEVPVLREVTFKVEHGDSVGLVGPSGGGKSTIFALLQRFYDPAKGKVYITSGRVPLDTVDIRWWRSQIGFVGQEPILFDTTVKGNIVYGNVSVTDDWLQQCMHMAKIDFLKGEGLNTPVGPRGGRLSGGQKQRVAICRALVRDPAIMIMDEATSALDSASEKIVQAALDNAMKGRTSFAIAHRLSTIERCKVLLVCAEGRIVEQGNHATLMARNGVYAKLHGH